VSLRQIERFEVKGNGDDGSKNEREKELKIESTRFEKKYLKK
jgi:hypothetical protein